MAYFYTYIDPSEIEDQFSKKVDEDEDDKDKREKAEIKMVRRDSAESYDDSYKQSNMWTLYDKSRSLKKSIISE